MIKIKYLCQFPQYVPDLANIWKESIGTAYLPDVTAEDIEVKLKSHLNQDILPLTYVALDDDKAIGMASLRSDDGITSDLFPWLGSLCVSEGHRKRGVGKLLIDLVKIKARKMGFKKLYLSTFDEKLIPWYKNLGWMELEKSSFKGLPITIMSIDISYTI